MYPLLVVLQLKMKQLIQLFPSIMVLKLVVKLDWVLAMIPYLSMRVQIYRN